MLFIGWVSSDTLLRGTNEFVILRDIHKISESGELTLFRCHLWLNINKEKRLRKAGKHTIITFTAEEYEYVKADLTKSISLKKVRNVEILGKIDGSGRNVSSIYKKVLKNKEIM